MLSTEDDMGQVNGWGHPRWKAKKTDTPLVQEVKEILQEPSSRLGKFFTHPLVTYIL